jgi:uncharacterized protein (TIGR03083 family)
MTDDAQLSGLDPFDLLDQEAARLDRYFSRLPEDDWPKPSRCAGWSIRDVLAHLAASEDYHHACLDGTVQAFVGDIEAKGATDLAAANALGIAELSDLDPQQLIVRWREANAETRRRFRQRGHGRVDTSVGDYPSRWQAFHVASELATHADDASVPVAPAERDARCAWRTRVSRFALAETKPDLTVSEEAGRTRVQGQGIDVSVDGDEFVEAVAGRLDETSRLEPAVRTVLSATP